MSKIININKTILFSLIFLISTFLLANSSTIANAQSNNTTEVKILPSSPFYFLKELSRGIQMFFTFNPIKKAEIETKFSDEKLNEALIVIKKEPENQKAIEKAFNNYQKAQKRLAQKIEKLKESSQNPKVDELLAKVTEKAILHQIKLDELKTLKPTGLPLPVSAPISVLPSIISKDTPEKFVKKIEQATEELPYELKEIKAIEILNRVETQVAEPAKPVIAQVKEKLEEKVITKIAESPLVPILPKVQQIPAAPEAKLKILEELVIKAPKVLPQKVTLEEIQTNLSSGIKSTQIIINKYPQCGLIQCFKYDPVCGVDGKTYACGEKDAEACGVKVAYKGECKTLPSQPPARISVSPTEFPKLPKPTTPASPTIMKYPQCGLIQCFKYDPVCGVDGKTYACGEKDAEACGVKVAYKGECKKGCMPRPACLDANPPCKLPEPVNGLWCPPAPEIISFSIVPSISEGGWTMYKDGAKAVLIAKNIKSATVIVVFSGTDINNPTKLGEMVKVAEGRWELTLPKFLLVTNFWAEATKLDNSVIKSKNLGNVGYEE